LEPYVGDSNTNYRLSKVSAI